MSLPQAITGLVQTPGLLTPYKPLQGLQKEKVSYGKVVRTYRELIAYIDKLMVHEADIEDIEGIEESTMEEQQGVQRLRRLVMEQTLMTLPVLKGIHQVEGIPFQEDQLGDKINTRDELSVDILHLLKSIEQKEDMLNQLRTSNKNLSVQIESMKDKVSISTTQKRKLQEPLELTKAKEKSYLLTEDIHALIITNGLNWSEDEELKNIVFYCSDIYK